MENTEIMAAEPVRSIVGAHNANDEVTYQASNYSTIRVTKENVKIIANAVNTSKSLNQVCKGGSTVFNVIGIIAMPGVRKSRDANIPDTPCTNTMLVCDDGNAYFTQSEGIRKSADALRALGVFDSGETVALSVVETKTQNGNTVKSLLIS